LLYSPLSHPETRVIRYLPHYIFHQDQSPAFNTKGPYLLCQTHYTSHLRDPSLETYFFCTPIGYLFPQIDIYWLRGCGGLFQLKRYRKLDRSFHWRSCQ
jgi:hypothetical protein